MKTMSSILGMIFLLLACTSGDKPYTHYLLDPQVEVPPDMIQTKSKSSLETARSERSIKSRWNNGETYTEVDIPILASGQRIIIDHKAEKSGTSKPGPEIVLLGPSKGDTAHLVMHNAYLGKGFLEETKAPEVSLSQARIKLDAASRQQNFGLALRIIERVLSRYPSHPEFLRAKASVLLLLGEKDKAVETYEQAQDLEPDPSVEHKLRELSP